MKTAMQELIEKLDYSIKNSTDTHKVNFAWIKFHCELLLELEKKIIINAHTTAYLIGEDFISWEDANEASQKFYRENYN